MGPRFGARGRRSMGRVGVPFQSVACLWPHSLQANFTRVAPFAAEMRFGAPHLLQVVSMRVLPCLTVIALRAMVSRISRSASSRIDCFHIRTYLVTTNASEAALYHLHRLCATPP